VRIILGTIYIILLCKMRNSHSTLRKQFQLVLKNVNVAFYNLLNLLNQGHKSKIQVRLLDLRDLEAALCVLLL